MNKRQPRRTDQEWMDLIQECRSSGISDRTWCEEHHIQPSTFYYHIRRLRKQACSIPESSAGTSVVRQEVAAVTFDEIESPKPLCPQSDTPSFSPMETAVRIHYHGLQIDIANSAAGTTIRNTIAALQKLC